MKKEPMLFSEEWIEVWTNGFMVILFLVFTSLLILGIVYQLFFILTHDSPRKIMQALVLFLSIIFIPYKVGSKFPLEKVIKK